VAMTLLVMRARSRVRTGYRPYLARRRVVRCVLQGERGETTSSWRSCPKHPLGLALVRGKRHAPDARRGKRLYWRPRPAVGWLQTAIPPPLSRWRACRSGVMRPFGRVGNPPNKRSARCYQQPSGSCRADTGPRPEPSPWATGGVEGQPAEHAVTSLEGQPGPSVVSS
jgi:hypothetical protein